MKLSKLKKLSLTLLFGSILLGCNNTPTKTGYLVAPLNSDIQYKCGKKSSSINRKGMFKCHSFPISFYVDSKPIGSITSIHNDGYVFTQDLVQDNRKTEKGIKLSSL